MEIDREGGMGHAGIGAVFTRQAGQLGPRGGARATPERYVAAICTPEAPRDGVTAETPAPAPIGRGAKIETPGDAARLASSE